MTRNLVLTALVAVTVATTACQPPLRKVLWDYGRFYEIRPASTLLAPGSVMSASSYAPLTADLICDHTLSLGPVVPLQSATPTAQLSQELKRAFKIEADYLKKLQSTARYSSVKDITPHLYNTLVLELQDADVYQDVTHRAPACWQAIAGRQANHYSVLLVKSVLKADVVYQVTFNSDVSAKAQVAQDLMKGLS